MFIGIGPAITRPGQVAAAPAYTASAVTFDGTNDWLTRASALAGTADSTDILISVWLKMNANDGVTKRIIRGSTVSAQLSRISTNKLRVFLRNAAGVSIGTLDTSTSVTVASGWVHFMASARLGANPLSHLYLNDADDKMISTALADDTIDWTDTSWFIANENIGTDLLSADMADLYLTNEYLDLSIEANRRKFIDANGKPVDLGSDGSNPTGTAPLIFFSGNAAVWNAGTNKGSGGNFTMTGAVVDAATSPSD